jgi:hypothetical protein
MAWEGPDEAIPIIWISEKEDEATLEISGKNLATGSTPWFNSWEIPERFFYHKQNLTLPSKPYETEGDYNLWGMGACFQSQGATR